MRRPDRLDRVGESPPDQAFIDAGLDVAVSALRAAAGWADRLAVRCRPVASELKRFALAHLNDPALSPEVVARASYISVRQLHRHFARQGTSFGAWVREERLRRCRDDLADRRFSHMSVAEVAARWGFRSAAHFTRAFHARFGVTPASLRRSAR
jgi:AraC-like DNA-binding protein